MLLHLHPHHLIGSEEKKSKARRSVTYISCVMICICISVRPFVTPYIPRMVLVAGYIERVFE
jgi:hypothetical protein